MIRPAISALLRRTTRGLALGSAVAFLVLAVGCTATTMGAQTRTTPPRTVPSPSAGELDAQRLMTKYGLHPVGEPQRYVEKLSAPDMMTRPSFDASKRIGLDLSSHIGESLPMLSYLLKERSQSSDGTITATFFLANDKVVGAVLLLWGYAGGGPALDEHDQFAPPGPMPTPDHLVFEGVRSIYLGGQAGRVIGDPATIQRLLAFILASKRLRSPDVGSADEVCYYLDLTYTNGAGAEIRIQRPPKGGSLYITFFRPDSLSGLYLAPAKGMIPYINKLLAARSRTK